MTTFTKKVGPVAISSLALLSAAGLASGAAFSAAAVSTGARPGTVYVGHPFPGDPFQLKVSASARSAKFVGTFIYTDPGCPGAAFGNEYLTSANAPKVTVSARGAFTGTRTERGGGRSVTDRISGQFDGKKASATFEETESCRGDKPLELTFEMKAR